MSSRRWMPGAAIALLLASTLAACSGGEPSPPPTTAVASRTPLFATDAEALEAATAAYAAYVKMSDTIAHDGGAHPERIKPYVTASFFSAVAPSYEELKSTGRHAVGETEFRNVQLSSYSDNHVVVFLCSDVSHVELIDSAGKNVTPSSRQDVLSLNVQLRWSSKTLLISESTVWSARDFCSH